MAGAARANQLQMTNRRRACSPGTWDLLAARRGELLRVGAIAFNGELVEPTSGSKSDKLGIVEFTIARRGSP